MNKIYQNEELYNKFYVFDDRLHAGAELANFIPDFDVIVAIPAGGVPVAAEVTRAKNRPLKLLLVSKILFPWTTEAGFGALSMFGDFEINDEIAQRLGEEVVEKQIMKTKQKIDARRKLFSEKFLLEEKGKSCVLIDDGLASGYTMLVAIKSARRFFREVFVATPTASTSAVRLVADHCDGIYVLNLRDVYPFAVADAYREWHDVSDAEMLRVLKNL